MEKTYIRVAAYGPGLAPCHLDCGVPHESLEVPTHCGEPTYQL